jgi:hypothetical protein
MFESVFNFILFDDFLSRIKNFEIPSGEGAVFVRRGHISSPRLTALCEDSE